MIRPPTAEMIARINDKSIFRKLCAANCFPIFEKPEIAKIYPGNWMTFRVTEALKKGDAELALSIATITTEAYHATR
jgi:phenylacetate-CoA ligase